MSILSIESQEYILAIYGVSNDDVSVVFFTFYAYLCFAVEFLASCWGYSKFRNQGMSGLRYRYLRIMSASLSVCGLSQEDMVVSDRLIAGRLLLGYYHDECSVLLRDSHTSKDPLGCHFKRWIPS